MCRNAEYFNRTPSPTLLPPRCPEPSHPTTHSFGDTGPDGDHRAGADKAAGGGPQGSPGPVPPSWPRLLWTVPGGLPGPRSSHMRSSDLIAAPGSSSKARLWVESRAQASLTAHDLVPSQRKGQLIPRWLLGLQFHSHCTCHSMACPAAQGHGQLGFCHLDGSYRG